MTFSKNPILRFRNFNLPLLEKKLGEEVILRKNKFDPKKNHEIISCIELESIEKDTGSLIKIFNSNDLKSTKNVFFSGDVLYGKLRPYLRKFYYAKFDGICSSEIWVLNGINLLNKYLYFLVQTNRFNYLANVSSGTRMPRAEWKLVSNFKIYVPSREEQSKISDFLTYVDNYIQNLKSQKEELEKYKKALMQKIFSQQLRFKDENGKDFPEWKTYNFKELIEERRYKSKINNEYEVISSTINGIFSQKEYFDREIASKNNIGYKIIQLNDLVFSPQNLWLGNININKRFENGIVSPSYKVYKINNEIVLTEYFINIIKLPRMLYEYELSSEQGASIVRRNLNLELFYSIPIKLPSINEQFKISKFLSRIDETTEQKVKELDALQKWKKGLMQQMFI